MTKTIVNADDLGRDLAALERMSVGQLVAQYTEVFGESTNGRNKVWLVRRIGWRLQARAEGGLSERAKTRASELARNADLRVIPPRTSAPAQASSAATLPVVADPRLPPPGTILTRRYKRTEVRVVVRADGFVYQGEVYSSLSAAAKAITGSHLNGFAFFHLGDTKR